MSDALAQTGLQEVFSLLATRPRREMIGTIREAVTTINQREIEGWDSWRSDVGQQAAAVIEPSESEQLSRLNARLSRAWFDLQSHLASLERAPFVDGSPRINKAVEEWTTLLSDA